MASRIQCQPTRGTVAPLCARALLAVLALALLLRATAADEWVSAQPWRTGLVYSVYDPVYGRASPEVQRDQTMRRTALTLRGRSYAHGYGAVGFSIVELDVPAGTTALEAVVGIDDLSTPSFGDTYFSLWADGERLWLSPALSAADAALHVTVPVAGRRRLKLLTDAQAYGNTDLADWCDVRWLRTTGPRAGSDWLPAPDAWHLRAEFRPFHLAYRGTALALTAVAAQPGATVLSYRIVAASGGTVLKGEAPLALALAAGPGPAATDTLRVPLADIANGLYGLELDLTAGQRLVAQRSLHFGVIESRLGRPVSGTIYGVNHHEFVASYEPIAAAGIEWSRLWFCRQWIEPQPRQWQWSWYDERLAAAREVGVKSIGVLGGIGQPVWTSPEHTPETRQTTEGCPTDLAAWEEYVRQIATRYRGQIRVWESWNEIMAPAEAGQDGWSVAAYVDLHRRAWQVLKSVDPENRLLVSADRLTFVERCLEAGLGEAFDGVVVHPYRPSAAPEMGCANPSVGGTGDLMAVFGAARSWLDARQRRRAGVWATEIGWAVTGSEWPTVPIETHGQYLARTFVLAQGSGVADNVCWHDFALGMFGICDGQGFPRPALLAYAALTQRLLGARPSGRLVLDPPLHGFRFRRAATDVLALWSERGTAFALLKPPAALALSRFDGAGNASALNLDAAGIAVPVTGLVQYLEGPRLAELQISRCRPLTVSPESVDLIAGQSTRLQCTVQNLFAESAEVTISVALPAGFAPVAAAALTVPRGEQRSAGLTLTARRDAPLGTHAVPLTVALPGGVEATLNVYARVESHVALEVEPFDNAPMGRGSVPVVIVITNRDQQALSGELQLSLPAGMTGTPAKAAFAALPAGRPLRLEATLDSPRPPRPDDVLRVTCQVAGGPQVSALRALLPVVGDRDGDGVTDGWRVNAESSARAPGQGNLVDASIAPGSEEFYCQRLQCSRFLDGWVILHRDGQDRVVQGRRYRIAFRARQQGINGTVGVAVYNLQPWQSCGIESHFRVGPDWETVVTEFVASRDSSTVRFEFYFTETGTLWLEGMRLEEISPRP